MGHIYFVRHGQTVWNVENKICGATDIGLTPQGYQQAKALGESIRQQYKDIDLILTSPLSRAYETARVISEYTGIPFMVEERLKEQNFGIWEGRYGKGDKEFQEAKRMFCSSYSGGESMMKTAQRVYNLIDEVKKDRDHTYLLVAHNGIYRIIQSYFFDLTNEEFAMQSMSNCEIKVYEI